MTSAHVHPWLFWKLEAFRNESFFWCHFPKCSFGANLIFLMYSKQLYLSYYHKAPIFISAKKTYHSAKPTDQQRQSLMIMHEQCVLYDKQCLLFHHYVTLVARFYWQILHIARLAIHICKRFTQDSRWTCIDLVDCLAFTLHFEGIKMHINNFIPIFVCYCRF